MLLHVLCPCSDELCAGQAGLKEGRGCWLTLGGSPSLGCPLQLALSLSHQGRRSLGSNRTEDFLLPPFSAPKPQPLPRLPSPAPDGFSGVPLVILLGLILGRRSQSLCWPGSPVSMFD